MRLRTPARTIAAAWLWAAASCGEGDPAITTDRVERTERDRWGIVTCSPATADRTCTTHRALIGVSMGAGGAGQIGLSRPDLFDTIGMLGIPIVDWTYMLRQLRRSYLGGTCDRETILQNLDAIDDPDGPAFCGPVPGVERTDPEGLVLEATQDLNHWWTGPAAGRGADFGRDQMRNAIHDISTAYGNPFLYNPDSPYLPPGVPRSFLARSPEERCADPIVLTGVKHAETNPDGAFPVITVCDTATTTGRFSPEHPNDAPIEVLLAVDYNHNGIRDAAEPPLVMMHERFEDVGTGDAADRYDWQHNPLGHAGNWLHDPGEPFSDLGLDGVAGTGDYGEANGRFDYNPNVERFWSLNPRRLIDQVDPGQLERLNLWADAGLRDFLMSAAGTNWFWGALHARAGDRARDYTSFRSLSPPGAKVYDFLDVDFSRSAIGQHVYLRYGDPHASESAVAHGDGNHVGTGEQIIDRFLTVLGFAQSRFLDRDVRQVFEESASELIQSKSYFSEALGADREFHISFPPGYFLEENREQRYPVIYFLHGLGGESDQLIGSSYLFHAYMAESNREQVRRRGESDWAKFILVFPDSSCHGACVEGNFNTNHAGLDGAGPRFMDAFFELMAHVDTTYRTRVPFEDSAD